MKNNSPRVPVTNPFLASYVVPSLHQCVHLLYVPKETRRRCHASTSIAILSSVPFGKFMFLQRMFLPEVIDTFSHDRTLFLRHQYRALLLHRHLRLAGWTAQIIQRLNGRDCIDGAPQTGRQKSFVNGNVIWNLRRNKPLVHFL